MIERKLLRVSTDGTLNNTMVFTPDGKRIEGVVFVGVDVSARSQTIRLEIEVDPISPQEAAELIAAEKK